MSTSTDLGTTDAEVAALLVRLQSAKGIERGQLLSYLARRLGRLGLRARASELHRQALEIAPRDPRVQRSTGLDLFGSGAWAKGLELYDAGRWKLDEFAKFRRAFPHPEWQGAPVKGKRLLLWAEQGIGDQIMQARVLGPLLDAGAEITVESDPRMHPLLTRRWPRIKTAAQTVELPADLVNGQFDVHGSMFSAWRWADLAQPQPAYLSPDPSLVAAFRRAWATQGWKINVGLSWRSKAKENGHLRSVPEDLLQALVQRRDLTFHCLQYDADLAEISTLSKRLGRPIFLDRDSNPLKDIDRLTAQIAALDLVISIDNSTVHIAGAVGTPCWAILPAGSDWRWGAQGDHTPLYESVRLFRNTQLHHWGGVLVDLADALGNWRQSDSGP
ncbi:MAG: hypothetical protein AAFN27_22435 [Pseudomonadota bacterium]